MLAPGLLKVKISADALFVPLVHAVSIEFGPLLFALLCVLLLRIKVEALRFWPCVRNLD